MKMNLNGLSILFNWEFAGADIVMDWVAVVGVVSTVVLLLIEIIKTTREKKELQRDHGDIQSEITYKQESLSKEHNGLSKEHAQLCETGYRILDKVSAIDKFVAIEAERRTAAQKALSDGQQDIRRQVEAITRLYHELERLQIDNSALQLENQNLKMEISSLKAQIQELSMDYEQEYDTEDTQTLR